MLRHKVPILSEYWVARCQTEITQLVCQREKKILPHGRPFTKILGNKQYVEIANQRFRIKTWAHAPINSFGPILVPRGRALFGQHQESRRDSGDENGLGPDHLFLLKWSTLCRTRLLFIVYRFEMFIKLENVLGRNSGFASNALAYHVGQTRHNTRCE